LYWNFPKTLNLNPLPFQPRLNSKSVSHALDLFPRIRHFQREICYVYVMYAMKKNCNLYFWKIVVHCSLKIYCVHVYGVLVRRV
jgi:hypothetical protein